MWTHCSHIADDVLHVLVTRTMPPTDFGVTFLVIECILQHGSRQIGCVFQTVVFATLTFEC